MTNPDAASATPTPCAVVLGGGLALGAYQVGALTTLIASGRFDICAIAGSSIGAMNAALLASNPPERWSAVLAEFWDAVATDSVMSPFADMLAASAPESVRHLRNWTFAAISRLNGVPNLFQQRWPTRDDADRPCASLYSAEPNRKLLNRLIDFERLNTGQPRLCIGACDVERGEAVTFDTLAGDRIAVDHLLASGALIPAFSPLRIGDRLLSDGGFAANAPLEPFLSSDRRDADWPLVILIDLFSPDDAAPVSLEAGIARSTDLQFAMQTRMRLAGLVRERALEARLTREARGVDLFHLSYRPLPHEAGPEKTYDFSRATLRDRMDEGRRDAELLLERIGDAALSAAPGLRVHPIRRS